MRRVGSALSRICAAVALLAAIAAASDSKADTAPTPEVVRIWPGTPPGTEDWTGPEADHPLTLKGAPPLRMVTNITVPTLTVFRPAQGKANGTAVIVCPGGGFQALAVTHEGELVAQWLAKRGVTGFVLKYRVRPSPNFEIPSDLRQHPEKFDALARTFEPGRQIAVADGTQAIRFLRANAVRFGIAPNRLGIMGFSAGAVTTMGVVMDSEPADRPNFAAPIYGTMEDKAPPKDGPPLFIAAAQDDPLIPATKSVAIFASWTAAELPAELHIYETGGHGFGILKRDKTADGWPVAFESWLRAHGWEAGK